MASAIVVSREASIAATVVGPVSSAQSPTPAYRRQVFFSLRCTQEPEWTTGLRQRPSCLDPRGKPPSVPADETATASHRARGYRRRAKIRNRPPQLPHVPPHCLGRFDDVPSYEKGSAMGGKFTIADSCGLAATRLLHAMPPAGAGGANCNDLHHAVIACETNRVGGSRGVRSHRVGPSRARSWRTCLSSASAIASRSVLGGGILAAKSLT